MDSHLHLFSIIEPSSGKLVKMNLPVEKLYNPATMKVEYEEKIADWFTIENNQTSYIYDFGDRWMHEIKMEKSFPEWQG